jgi:dTDP-4-amino-4,6-dideoxy-D-galactose acyltransferase
MPNAPIQARDTLEPLPWDSRHFGFHVARIKGPELAELELRQALISARRTNHKLIYWAADPRFKVPQSILGEFHGLLVDRKVTFRRTLRNVTPESESAMCRRISEHPKSEPAFDLVRLAVSAGAYSRFRLDPRIPKESFGRLYEIWINRSVLGDIADAVFVAARGTELDYPAGLITVSLTGREGSIGLIAVDESARGQGVGSHLIHAVHRWLLGRGARNVKVVTQLDNHKACRLYEKCGYSHAELQHVYHFWPQGKVRCGPH